MLRPESFPKDRSEIARRAAIQSHATKKLRGVDPVTCDHDYTTDELEFMAAIAEYQASSGRKFPTWREILQVVKGLGYEKTVTCKEAVGDPTS